MKKKLPSLKSLHEKAWKIQSEYVRRKDANFQGYNYCYTCGRVFFWKELQAGHFIHNSYDFDMERNIRAQCAQCNKWGHGKPLDYYLHLVAEIGQDSADEARTRKHWNDYKRDELMELIEKYTRLLSELSTS